MSPAAISPASPSSPTPGPSSTTAELTKAGIQTSIAPIADGAHTPLPDLDASKLTITYTASLATVPQPNSREVWSQKITTDHMLTCRWHEQHGWAAPQIAPYGPLSLMPTASVLHYATECFEGMKCFRGHDGKLRLFRPEKNCARMLRSATRIALPAFDPAQLQRCIERFVAVDGPRWLPDGTDGQRGQFLYLRPTMIATNAAIGVQKPTEALLFVVAVCFPALDQLQPQWGADLGPGRSLPSTAVAKDGGEKGVGWTGKEANGMRLLASKHDMIRAWPGGFGNAKVGANYGPSLMAQQEARSRGYNQVLWLFGPEGYVTEAGASNFFVVWETSEGKRELVTAPLGDEIILEGVTRASVLDVARDRMSGELEVVEKRFTMDEIVKAHEEGRLIEAFATGTAVFIAPVSDIHFRGRDVDLPLKKGVEARYAMGIKKALRDIMFGDVPHSWGVVVEEEGVGNINGLHRA